MAGKLTPDGLKTLEAGIAKAVSAAVPMALPPHVGKPDVPRRGDPKTDYSVKMKQVADWTSVAHHRANYYLVEQQRKADAHNQRKDELHELLAHQIQQVDHDKRLRRCAKMRRAGADGHERLRRRQASGLCWVPQARARA
eukprot:4661327-Prymnesium_polylepis.1